MSHLQTLGGLRLESNSFTQPKPLVLLSYLSLEGSKQRRHLAELFWSEGNRMKSLSMTLTRLRQGAGDVVEADDKQAKVTLSSDAKELLESLDKSNWQQANNLYTGAFLEGVVLEDWSSELEEWIYTTREYLAERVQYALLNLADAAAKNQDFDKARNLGERAYKLPGLGGTDITHLKRLYPLLCASNSLLAPEVRKELDGYGITVQLNREEAQATFQRNKGKEVNLLPTRQTSFVGREVELNELANRLTNIQLVTILGTGGVGKTRLALQLAFEQQKLTTFEQVYFVSLESISSSEFILPAILNTLAVTQQHNTEPLEKLINVINQRSVLIILDNLEHLLDKVHVLSSLIQKCPNLKLLVTSRERLGLEEEHLFSLEGLPLPTSITTLEEAKNVEAVTLFKERAQQLQPQFELKEQLDSVIRICKLVEGLPLAIELAASWVRLMSCHEIASEIEHSLEFLATTTRNIPERHRSLKAAFEYSWNLLNSKEQEVLQKLSVFVGGFRREAASEVAGATIPILASLVDKSLLRVLPNGRYDRHPLLYQFTQEKLLENPHKETEVSHKHQVFYLNLARQAEAQFYTKEAKTYLKRFDEELDNVRSVLARADSETGLHLMTDLAEFWASRSLYGEGRKYLKGFLESAPDKTSLYFVKGLYTLADFAWTQGDFEEAKILLEQALLLAQALDDKNAVSRVLGLLARIYQYNESDNTKARSLYEECIIAAELAGNIINKASALNLMAILVSGEGDFEAAQTFYQESLNLHRKAGHTSGVAYVLNNLANIYDIRGDYSKAQRLFEQSLELFREVGDREGIGMALGNLGSAAIKRGKYSLADQLFQESLKLRRELGDNRATAYVLNGLAQLAFHQENYPRARELFEEAHALNSQLGYKLGVGDSLRFLGEVHHATGDIAKARALFQEGLALCRSINDTWGIANITRMLAVLEIEQQNDMVARTLLEESLYLACEMNSQGDSLYALEGFALLETEQGNVEKAGLLWGFCDTLRQTVGRTREKLDQQHYERSLKQIHQVMGKKVESILNEAQSMTLEQILSLMLKNPTNTNFAIK